jgi:hypothetical protein
MPLIFRASAIELTGTKAIAVRMSTEARGAKP